jgi:hypothetical protein
MPRTEAQHRPLQWKMPRNRKALQKQEHERMFVHAFLRIHGSTPIAGGARSPTTIGCWSPQRPRRSGSRLVLGGLRKHRGRGGVGWGLRCITPPAPPAFGRRFCLHCPLAGSGFTALWRGKRGRAQGQGRSHGVGRAQWDLVAAVFLACVV